MTELEYDLGSFLLTVSRFAAFLLEWYECRHVFRYSHLLLSRRLVVKVIILSFSSVQIPHLEGVVDTGGDAMIDQLMLWGVFFRFRYQMNFESSVSFSYFAFRNDFMWFAYLVLKVPPVMPMYDVTSLLFVVTSAW